MAYTEVLQNSRRRLLTKHYGATQCLSFVNALHHVFCSSAVYDNGFRRKRRTEITATIFVDTTRRNMDEGRLTDAIFIDISKAFDTSSHNQIIANLSNYRVYDTEILCCILKESVWSSLPTSTTSTPTNSESRNYDLPNDAIAIIHLSFNYHLTDK